MDELQLRVERITPLTERVSAFTLVDAAAGAPLPGWQAGAHIEVAVQPQPGREAWRAYSLILPAGGQDDRRYEIAVQREDAGTGGSLCMHRLREGDVLRVRRPANHFPLAAGAREALLLAGGIGITPILSMARALQQSGVLWALHFAAREPQAMPYREAVQALPDSTLYFDGGDPARGVPLHGVLAQPAAGRHLYVCGPRGMVDAAVRTARELGWDDAHVHYELFAGALAADGDAAFKIECGRGGRVLVVPSGKSMLDVLIEEGFDPLFDCRTGTCGVCVTPVLDGTPDHRDSALGAAEKQAGRQVCICVSRASTPRLVLDL